MTSNSRITLMSTLLLAAGGCNSLLGFELEGGGDGPSGETKTLVVILTGDARGSVTSLPTGINCATGGTMNCSEDYPRNSMVTLTAVAGGGSRFAGWTGGGCSGTGACRVTLGIDTSVEARFDDTSGGHNFAFVTTDAYPVTSINGSLVNADAICASEAMAAGIPGTYRAWLSTTAMAARDRLGTSRGWVRMDGLPVVDTVADLVANKMRNPIRITASGAPVMLNASGHTVVMTGTLGNGTKAMNNCADWTLTGGAGMTLLGNANYVGAQWTEWFDGACVAQHLLCFGTDRSVPLTITPATGRLAFLSNQVFNLSSGIASADSICQMEATNAGRSGTFKALLALSNASAASRFDTTGAPWVRADGVPIAAPGTSPFEGVQTAINVWVDGTYSAADLVATGASSPTANATTDNCNDWTSSSGSQSTILGFAMGVPDWFANNLNPGTLPCSGSLRVYCFQQ